VWVLENSDLVS